MLYCRSFALWFGREYSFPLQHTTPNTTKLRFLKKAYMDKTVYLPDEAMFLLRCEFLGAWWGWWKDTGPSMLAPDQLEHLLATSRLWDYVHYLILTHCKLLVGRDPHSGHRLPTVAYPGVEVNEVPVGKALLTAEGPDTDAKYMSGPS